MTVFGDADGDGHHGQTLSICSDAPIPTGFSADTQGQDSTDENPRLWSGTVRSCHDADGDGHFVDCDGYPEGEDCNDSAGFIRPGAIETVGTNFDCDSSTNISVDETQGIFVTSSGNDTAPCGTRADPCRSLGRADELLSAEPAGSQRRYIFVGAGLYAEDGLTLRHSVIGGFSVSGVSGTTWTRSISARPENGDNLTQLINGADGGPRLLTQGDRLVFDGLSLTGGELSTSGNCTSWSMQSPAPSQGSGTPAQTYGNLIIHSYVSQTCGDLAVSHAVLTGEHPVLVARSTLQLEGGAFPSPNTAHAVDLSPRADTWFEDTSLTVSQIAWNRYGIRFLAQTPGVTLHLRNVRIELQGSPLQYQNAFGVHAFDGHVRAEELVAVEQESPTIGSGYGMLVSRTGGAPVRADVVRSSLRVRQTAFGIDGGDARIVQSYLHGSTGEIATVHVAAGSRLVLLNSVVESDAPIPVAVLADPGATELVAINSIFDVAREDRPVTGIRTTDTPVRLLNNAFSLSANTDPGECPVDVAGQACAGFSVNDCGTWGSLCTESLANLVAPVTFVSGGSPGEPFEALHLPESSPCIDAGLALSGTELLPGGSRWLLADVDGDARPVVGWDIGLDERP